ncbi:AAA family ATPase, partial [Amaricoccus sp. HAR-UPW-R2A-40]
MTDDVRPYSDFTGSGAGDGPRNYIIDPQDALVVDLAIKLGRPLLVEGEAGCGKSSLADAIAAELGLGDPVIVPIRSSSRSNDLFYRYDGLVRLQDRDADPEKARKAQNYITLEPVGKAIVEGQRKVILIDEIDKADMDFQNDLLFALERFEFVIDDIPASETGKVNGVAHRMRREGPAKPIIMFTSNQEKLLPKPFLRRCFYLELKFPTDPDRLEE